MDKIPLSPTIGCFWKMLGVVTNILAGDWIQTQSGVEATFTLYFFKPVLRGF